MQVYAKSNVKLRKEILTKKKNKTEKEKRTMDIHVQRHLSHSFEGMLQNMKRWAHSVIENLSIDCSV